MAKITLIGMYNFDDTLFEYLTLPEGIDKETLINNILMQSSEFEVLYPNLDFLKMSIGAWAKKWQPTFERWQKALAIEYDPLENYDRKEEWNGTDSGNSTGKTEGTTGSLTTNRVSAYDSGDALTTRDTVAINGSDSTNNTGSFSNKRTNAGRVHGNIGVTTSQMMLTSELNLGYWNIYEKITDIFLTEFVLPIY